MIKNQRNEAERTATYFIEVPVKFCFKALSALDIEEIIGLASAEIDKRLGDAQVSIDTKNISVAKKWIDYTAEERREQDRRWKEILGRL